MIYQIKVKVKHIRPAIWRRIQVGDNITLRKFHTILQVVMGWGNYHLHEFEIDGCRYAPTEDEFGEPLDFSDTVVSDKKVRLSQVVSGEKARFLYTYDFGDDWQHELLVEKIMPAEKGRRYPICIKGERACPHEDCGGTQGYYQLLDARKHPEDPDCAELLEWAGDYDPEKFDVDAINACLQRMR